MGRCGVLTVSACFAGCYLSHPWIGDEPAGRDSGVRDDAAIPDTDTYRDADTGDDAEADEDGRPPDGRDGRDVDAAEASCWDNDDDGHPDVVCGGDDCDDDDPAIYPGAADACGDGRDTDCDGMDATEGLLGASVLLFETPVVSPSLYTNLVWTGREFLFLWRFFGGEGVFMQRLDPLGRRTGEEVRLRDFEYGINVAWSGNRVATVWRGETADPFGPGVFFQAFDSSGVPLTDVVAISGRSATLASDVRVVGVDGDFLIAWAERVEPDDLASINAVRVGPDGDRRFDAVRVALRRMDFLDGFSLTFSRYEATVAWNARDPEAPDRPGDVEVQRVGHAGELLGVVERIAGSGYWSGPVWGLPLEDDQLVIWGELETESAAVMLARRGAGGAETLRRSLTPPLSADWQLRPFAWTGHSLAALWTPIDLSRRVVLWKIDLSATTAEPIAELSVESIVPGRSDILWTGNELAFTWEQGGMDEGDPPRQVRFQRATFCE